MSSNTPAVAEVNMNAKIGEYPTDFDEDRKPVVLPPRTETDDYPAPERWPWPEM